jgi:hypothetical protein
MMQMDDPYQAMTSAFPMSVGEIMSVAARLGQQAGDGEILITDATYRLVREAAEVEKLESPIDLRQGVSPPVGSGSPSVAVASDHR